MIGFVYLPRYEVLLYPEAVVVGNSSSVLLGIFQLTYSQE